MDPNQALNEIRDLYEAIIVLYDSDGSRNDELIDKANELACKINDLDLWLTQKGFMPKEWAAAARHPLRCDFDCGHCHAGDDE